MMHAVLAVDVANEGLSLALLDRDTGHVLHQDHEYPTRSQAEHLAPRVVSLLEHVSLTPSHVKTVVCTTGPGGFSGVRVGLAFCRAFAFALGIPFQGYTTLQALAYGQKDLLLTHKARLLVAFTAGRGQFYMQGFDENAFPLTPQLCLTKAHIMAVSGGISGAVSDSTRQDAHSQQESFHTFLHSFPSQEALVIAGSGSIEIANMLESLMIAPLMILPQERVNAVALGLMSLSSAYPTHTTLYLREADATVSSKKARPVEDTPL